MEEIKENGGLAFGKSFRQFQEMIAAVKTGKTIEMHGVDFVVMDRKRYEELTTALEKQRGEIIREIVQDVKENTGLSWSSEDVDEYLAEKYQKYLTKSKSKSDG